MTDETEIFTSREMAQAVAKVHAYLNCSKYAEAKVWADKVREMLAKAGV